MALTDAQRRQLERRLQDERARIQRALDWSIDEHSNESDLIPRARTCGQAGA